MKKNSIDPSDKLKPVSKTDWNKVINQTDIEILRNANSDPESPILNHKKYYKPEKLNPGTKSF
jgi:hypothetical protein